MSKEQSTPSKPAPDSTPAASPSTPEPVIIITTTEKPVFPPNQSHSEGSIKMETIDVVIPVPEADSGG